MENSMKQTKERNRGVGVLMPISSLPGPYGIGTLGKEAYRFADFIRELGGSYWQVLPIGPTSFGDSPYQSFSAFAGNPYFIDLDTLIEEGLLLSEEVGSISWGQTEQRVDYGALAENRFTILRKAFARSRHAATEAYRTFERENAYWLPGYSLYMAVKWSFGQRAWSEWEDDIRLRKPEAEEKYKAKLAEEIAFWSFCQFKFDEQWKKWKKYTNSLGIEIIGDIPLYVSKDSADVWVHSELFELDEDLREINIAGVPPDLFSETGQRWGNPLYRWDVMEKDDFSWWRERMKASAYHYDVIRIDHFIGIVNYYSIPAECPTAVDGEWKQGPGRRLTDMMNATIGSSKIIAEDLGILTPPVRGLMEENGYPGMKILEFALDMSPENEYLPHNFRTDNVVAYIGTHDNETLAGSLKNIPDGHMAYIAEYYGAKDRQDVPRAMIKALYASVARVAILQMQDLLHLDNDARMNFPATMGNNWQWRMTGSQYAVVDPKEYVRLAKMYGRWPADRKHTP